MSTILNQGGRTKGEQEALEVAEESRETEWERPSFVADLFMGKVQWNAVSPFPEQDSADKKIGDELCRKIDDYFKANVDANEIDEKGDIPPQVMKGLADLGLFGMKIPKKYGGLGLTQVNYLRGLETVARHCSSIGATLSAHQSIGVPQPLYLFGTDAQKDKYLPMFAKGAVSAFALTEPEVGSDPARMSTTATPTPDGQHYVLNGKKLWCTNGPIADVMVVMAITPSIMVNGREKKQITAFIVEKDMPGVKTLHRCRFMGLNGIQNGLLEFTNVKVPKENVIWGLGKGLRLALITLNAGRLSLPSACVGGMKQALEYGMDWANSRTQWGTLIGGHEAVANKIGALAAHTYAIEAMTHLAGIWVDHKTQDIRLEAAMAKVYGSVQSHRLGDEMLQVRGGRGYERATSLKARGEKPFPLERMARDSRINQIVEGTSEILRLFIAREALDKHLKVAGEVLNPKAPMGKRLATAVKAAFFYAVWLPKQFLWIPSFGGGKLGCHRRFVACTAKKLARRTFFLMLKHGPKLEKQHMQLMRIVDVGMDLFAMSAALGRAATSSSAYAEELADVFCRDARFRVMTNFRALCCNSDKANRGLAKAVLGGQAAWITKSY